MKASELIRELQSRLIDNDGFDPEVTVYDDMYGEDYELICTVAYTNKDIYPKINGISLRFLAK